MKAMIVNKFGGTEVFEKSEVNKPFLKSGHILVKVAATSVNTVDTMIRQMGPELPLSPAPPAILGMDFAGTVEEIGEGVTKFSVGDEVYGCAGGLADLQGALAEFMLADENLVALKPKTLSMREAAAIPLVGITAYEGLTRAGVHKGQKVLVHGGAGGVGHLAVQLANHFGATVFSTGGTEEQLDLIKELGATSINFKNETVDDYVRKYTEGRGFDVIFDSVGGQNLLNSFNAAALNSHIATTVSLLEIDLTTVHFKGLSLHVVFMLIPMLHNHQRKVHGDILSKLSEIIDSGKIKPHLDAQNFSLEDIGDAHARLASGTAVGKIVVSI